MKQSLYTANQVLKNIREKKETFWLEQRKKNALVLFQKAAARIPAYKDFLRKHRVSPKKVKTWEDFERVPWTSKENYLRKYPFVSLHWDGKIDAPMVFTSTSGSTGEPFYFSRNAELDWQYSILAQLYLENNLYGVQKPTLVVVCFGMGVWIGGVLTYKAFEIASQRTQYPISVITPGINKKEIFTILRKLAPRYAQTLITGYPPFLKDIFDEAPKERIDLEKLHIRTLFAAEAFTEKFRDYIIRSTSIANPMLDTLNIYGTADVGAMAFETPISILIRRLATANQSVFDNIFPHIKQKTPTLAQYNPLFITFESEHGEILLTGNNTIPFIRYAVGDHGGVYSYGDIAATCQLLGLDLEKEIEDAHLEKFSYQLPFVYVYERKDFSTTLYGVQIYPETIREVLLEGRISGFLTGRFTMITRFNQRQNQYIEINLELRKGKRITPQVKKLVREKVVQNLLMKNSEFRELHDHVGRRVFPRLVFWEAEHPLHFKIGIKQKWVKK